MTAHPCLGRLKPVLPPRESRALAAHMLEVEEPASGPKNPSDLFQGAVGPLNFAEHQCRDDCVEALVIEGEVLCRGLGAPSPATASRAMLVH